MTADKPMPPQSWAVPWWKIRTCSHWRPASRPGSQSSWCQRIWTASEQKCTGMDFASIKTRSDSIENNTLEILVRIYYHEYGIIHITYLYHYALDIDGRWLRSGLGGAAHDAVLGTIFLWQFQSSRHRNQEDPRRQRVFWKSKEVHNQSRNLSPMDQYD